MYRKTTEKSFEDVIFELEFAITEKNYRITGRNTIGSALRKRGYDDFPDAEVIHFCSLERARLVLQYDLDYLAQMPCRVTVHVENEHTVIHGIMLPTDHAITEVNALRQGNEPDHQGHCRLCCFRMISIGCILTRKLLRLTLGEFTNE